MCHARMIVVSRPPAVVFFAFRWGKSFAHPLPLQVQPAGIDFLMMQAEEQVMLGPLAIVLKNLVRCSLDNYILPGTVSGTEILWLYMVQWKRDLLVLACAAFALFVSHCELPIFERVFSGYRSGSDAAD
jgi:hypothetical protein